jgi:hypothetical protein
MSADNMRMGMVGVLGRIGKMLGMRGNAVAAAGIGRITEMIREKVVSSPNFKPAAPSIVNNATTVNNITTPVAPIGPSPLRMAASAATKASEALTPAVALAGGGRLPSGFAGIVGEMGPEFIAPANVNRNVTANDALGGQTVIVNQNFSAGVTHRELASLLPRMKQETISAVIEAKRRGGQFSRTF